MKFIDLKWIWDSGKKSLGQKWQSIVVLAIFVFLCHTQPYSGMQLTKLCARWYRILNFLLQKKKYFFFDGVHFATATNCINSYAHLLTCKQIINLNQGVIAQLNLVFSSNVVLFSTLEANKAPKKNKLYELWKKKKNNNNRTHSNNTFSGHFLVVAWLCQANIVVFQYNYTKLRSDKHWAQTNEVIRKHDWRIWKWKWYAWRLEDWRKGTFFPHRSYICGICGHSIDLEQNSIIYVTIFFGAMKNDMSKASIEHNAT